MKYSTDSLFRQEVRARQRERLSGSISIATPLSWQIVGFLFASALGCALCYLLLGTYRKLELVPGTIMLDQGAPLVVATGPGIVKQLNVSDGESVVAGTQLIQITSVDDWGGASGSSWKQVRAALSRQADMIEQQGSLKVLAGEAQEGELRAQIAAAQAEVTGLTQQVANQKSLIQMAELNVSRAEKIAERGFLSQSDLQAKTADLLSLRQTLSQLDQSILQRNAEIEGFRHGLARISASIGGETASIEASRAAIAEQTAQLNLAAGYVLSAPLDGKVTGVRVKPGQSVSSGETMMVVMPSDSKPYAELHAPSSAIGLLSVGQTVMVTIDAYPYEYFGSVRGSISAISSAPTAVDRSDSAEPIYLVRVALNASSMSAFGQLRPLLPGMSLSARIVTAERSLFEWLFEPLAAIGSL